MPIRRRLSPLLPARGTARSAACSAVILLAGCTGGDGDPTPARLAWSAEASAIGNPWPSDRLLSGGNAGTPPGYFTRVLPDEPAYDTARSFLEDAVAELATLGGYSVYAPIVMPASRRVDAGEIAGVHVVPEAGGAEIPLAFRWSEPLDALLAEPVTPLRGKTRYVVIAADGALKASAAFAEARETDPALIAMTELAVTRGFVDDASEVDLAFAFTTQPIEDDLAAAQARIDSPLGDDLLPAYITSAGLPFTSGVSTAGSAQFSDAFSQANANDANIGTLALGVFPAIHFRDANGRFDPVLLTDTSSTPSRITVDFRLAIPEGTPPPSGWPVVIASHGVSGDSIEPLQRAYSFAAAGAATIGATATDHGWRGNILDFFDFTRPVYVRDGFRQSGLEIVQIERMIRNAHAASIPPFDQLDPGDVTYFGNSFGGILGGTVSAASTHVDATGFAVSGGRLPHLFDGDTGEFLLAIFATAISLPGSDEYFEPFFECFRIVGQWAIDPADPGALAPAVPLDRPVLIQMAIGDTTFPNASSEDLRLALDLPVLDTPADPFTGRGGLWVWDVADFPEVDEDPHDLYWGLAPMRHQMEDFLLSHGTVLSAE